MTICDRFYGTNYYHIVLWANESNNRGVHKMKPNDKIKLFENQRIRTAWDEEKEEWYFSIVDVVGVLTDSVDPTAYWRKLKQRLKTGAITIPTRNIHSRDEIICKEDVLNCIRMAMALETVELDEHFDA